MKEKIKRLLNNFMYFIRNNKKLVTLIATILIVIILVLVFILVGRKNLIGLIVNPDGEKFESEYETLNNVETEEGKTYPKVKIPTNNIMKYTSVDEIVDMFNKDKDAVIYFGYPECLYCRSVVNVLLDVAADTKLDTIYYLNMNNVKDDDDDKLINLLGKELVDDNKINSPLVVFVVDGDIVSYNKGTLFSHEDPYVEMDKYQIEGLSEIYLYGINDVLGVS